MLNEVSNKINFYLLQTLNIVFWIIIVVVFFSSFIDFFIFNAQWVQFLMLKAVILILLFTVYTFPLKISTTLKLHLIILLFNILCISILVSINNKYTAVYFNILTLVFLLFNALTIWGTNQSIIQYVLVITLLVISILFKGGDYNLLLTSAGLQFIVMGFISTYFPRMRRLVTLSFIKNEVKEDGELLKLKNTLELNAIAIELQNKEKIITNHRYDFLVNELNSNTKKILDIANNFELKASAKIQEDLDRLLLVTENLKRKGLLYQRLPEPMAVIEDCNFDYKVKNIKNLYSQTINKFERFFKTKNISIQDTITNPSLKISIDETAFYLILKNILLFAFKYSKEGDTILVTIFEEKNQVYFSVSNTLNGVSSQAMEALFTNSKTKETDDKSVKIETIIDMNLTKNLTEHMGGYFDYESSLKKGFKLTVNFKKQ